MKVSWLQKEIHGKAPYFKWLLAFLLVFTVFHGFHLNLPYFWDEAWSYIPAIHELYRHGPSMLPGALPPDVYRGHPLLFYFLTVCWMKLFGTGFIALHGFALLISIGVLVTIFFLAGDFMPPFGALMAVLLTALQPVFMAQSTLLLPEMMLTLWILLSLFFYLRGNRLAYITCASLMLLTKETGVVMIGAIGIFSLFQRVASGGRFFSVDLIKHSLIIMVPVFIASTFFFIQKFTYGWFFFPEHLGMISFNRQIISDKFQMGYTFLFEEQSRMFFSVVILAGVLIKIINFMLQSHTAKADRSIPLLSFSFLFILLYFVFSSFNFFTFRYMLCLIPFWAIAGAGLTASILSRVKLMAICIFLITVLLSINENTKAKPTADFNLSYLDGIKVQKEIVSYAESNNLFDHRIYGTFLFMYYLGIPETGYVSGNRNFTALINKNPCQADYIIYSSIEQDAAFEQYSTQCNLRLMQRFRHGKTWGEIYKVMH